MAPQPKKIEVKGIDPALSINGIGLRTAIANVQIDINSDGTATFYLVGKISDSNEVEELKNYLQGF